MPLANSHPLSLVLGNRSCQLLCVVFPKWFLQALKHWQEHSRLFHRWEDRGSGKGRAVSKVVSDKGKEPGPLFFVSLCSARGGCEQVLMSGWGERGRGYLVSEGRGMSCSDKGETKTTLILPEFGFSSMQHSRLCREKLLFLLNFSWESTVFSRHQTILKAGNMPFPPSANVWRILWTVWDKKKKWSENISLLWSETIWNSCLVFP